MPPRPTSGGDRQSHRHPDTRRHSTDKYYIGQRRHSKQRKLGSKMTTLNTTLIPNGEARGQTTELESILATNGFNKHGRQHLQPPRVPLINSLDLQLRFLTPLDIPEVKRLCKEWFPIDYPDAWYNDIASNEKFYSVACIYMGKIIGIVVAEIKDYFKLPKEDSELLAVTFRSGTKVGYILSLGVVKEYRKNGVASFMLDNLIGHLTSSDHCPEVRAIYLHVLTTNNQAISFYEHRGFRAHIFLPFYYNIKGKRKDGFTYVLYVNGGHPPWSALDYVIHCCQMILLLNPWAITRFALRKANFALFRVMPRLRRIASSSTAMFS